MFVILRKHGNQKAFYTVNAQNIKCYFRHPEGSTIQFLDGSQEMVVTAEPEFLNSLLGAKEIPKDDSPSPAGKKTLASAR
jgi:hypothetical protein